MLPGFASVAGLLGVVVPPDVQAYDLSVMWREHVARNPPID
jgi:hypothetical protein